MDARHDALANGQRGLDLEERRRAFKKTQDSEEIRRKREDEEVQLRKSEKADILQKKRQNFREQAPLASLDAPTPSTSSTSAFNPESSDQSQTLRRPLLNTSLLLNTLFFS